MFEKHKTAKKETPVNPAFLLISSKY